MRFWILVCHTGLWLLMFTSNTWASTFETFTDSNAFDNSVNTNYSWGFDDFDYTPNKQVENVRGPGSATLHKALVSSGVPVEGGGIAGNFIYLNPQSPLGAFSFNSSAVTAVGFFATWADFYNPQGIEASFYDANDSLISSLRLDSKNTFDVRYLSPEASYRSLHYDGFFGLTSSTPISRVIMTEQYAGSVYYDGLLWYDSNPNPDPDPEPIVKPPVAPKSPKSTVIPKAPSLPVSVGLPNSPNLDSLFSAVYPVHPNTPKSPNSPNLVRLSSSYQNEQIPTTTNPEPATMLLFGSGMAWAMSRRRKLVR